VLSGAGPVDAVTTQAFEYRAAFASWGMDGDIHAAFVEPAVRAAVQPLSELEAAPDDLLVFHYSAYAPKLEPLLEWPQRKLLVYHNVTPAEWLWEYQPHVATLCAMGREHLPRWARAVDVAVAVSEYNAAELRAAGARDVRVVPIVMHPHRVRRDGHVSVTSGARILSVGRLAPHKRPDLVLRVFDLYRSACDPAARLDLVGEPLSPAYEESLRSVMGPGVSMHGRLDQEQLNELWLDADVFLTLSEHEGFCVPLLEAFATDTPVVARPIGGMREVGGNAVLWTADRDLAVIAELLDLAVRDVDLRGALVARGRQRLDSYAPEVVLDRLRAAVDAALSARRVVTREGRDHPA
jgi:glycosyltransferase involved in cell wall biosynthesis